VELADDEPAPAPAALPDSLVRFARTARFTTEAARLAKSSRAPEKLARQRLLEAMSGMAALTRRPMSDLDWHRILDTAILISR
jgi:hypothetical protein